MRLRRLLEAKPGSQWRPGRGVHGEPGGFAHGVTLWPVPSPSSGAQSGHPVPGSGGPSENALLFTWAPTM